MSMLAKLNALLAIQTSATGKGGMSAKVGDTGFRVKVPELSADNTPESITETAIAFGAKSAYKTQVSGVVISRNRTHLPGAEAGTLLGAVFTEPAVFAQREREEAARKEKEAAELAAKEAAELAAKEAAARVATETTATAPTPETPAPSRGRGRSA